MQAASKIERRERIKKTAVLAALGLVAGCASGFLGVGGGLVLVPGLMIALHSPIKQAVGISVVSVVFVSLVGVLAELIVKGANIHWKTAVVLTLGSLLGSTLGGWLLRRLPDTPLRWLFSGSLLFASARMLFLTCLGNGHGGLALSSTSALGTMVALPVGVLAGLSSTLFGIGGGIVTVPSLSLLFQDFGFHAARATSLATILPTSAFAAYQHERLGTVDFSVARCLIPPALLGAVLGVVGVNFLAAAPARVIFATSVALAALRVLTLAPSGLPGLQRDVSE